MLQQANDPMLRWNTAGGVFHKVLANASKVLDASTLMISGAIMCNSFFLEEKEVEVEVEDEAMG